MRVRPKWVAACAAVVMVVGGATVVSAANPAPESWAFVARGDNPVDALSAASLAGTLNAPVILTEQSQLTQDAADALEDAAPDNVVIAGGLVAITSDVEEAIEDLLPDADVRRVAGESRYDTSQRLSNLLRELDPAFLAVDGKANTAEFADKALDSDALGGIAAEDYSFVGGVADDGIIEVNFTERDTEWVDILPPQVVDVPVDGILDVRATLQLNSSVDGLDLVLPVLDFEEVAPDTRETDDLLHIYTALLGPLHFADPDKEVYQSGERRFVTAGQHEIRFLVLGADDDSDPEDEVNEFLFTELSFEFTANGDMTTDVLTEDDFDRRRNADEGALGRLGERLGS